MIVLVLGMLSFRFSITNFNPRSVCDENKTPQPSALPTETSGNFSASLSLSRLKPEPQESTSTVASILPDEDAASP